MIIFTHSIVGATLASKTAILPLAFLIGFVSHFILDAIPHVDPGTLMSPEGKEVKPWPWWVFVFIVIDITATLLFLYFIKEDFNFSSMIAGVMGAIIVDVISVITTPKIENWPVIKQINYLHVKCHYYLPRNKWYIGLITQSIIIGGFVWYLLKF